MTSVERTMYCRRCYYDLRGQVAHRCPECGTPFDPDNAETFFARRPRGAGHLWYWLQRRRLQFIVTLTLLWSISIWITMRTTPVNPSYRFRVPIISAVHLKLILIDWQIQQDEHPEKRPFDLPWALTDMRPRLSPWSERRAATIEYELHEALEVAPLYVIPAVVYMLLIAPFLRRRARKAAIAFALLLIPMLIVSLCRDRLLSGLFPGSRAFLQDYIYVPNPNLTSTNPSRGTTIAAYDWRTFAGSQRRIIGFADGHVDSLPDDRARRLFEANGLAYPDVPPEDR